MKKRIFDFDKYIKRRSGFFQNSRKITAGYKERLIRERPRDSLKQELLLEIDRSRVEQMLESGELKIEGPRIWRLKLT